MFIVEITESLRQFSVREQIKLDIDSRDPNHVWVIMNIYPQASHVVLRIGFQKEQLMPVVVFVPQVPTMEILPSPLLGTNGMLRITNLDWMSHPQRMGTLLHQMKNYISTSSILRPKTNQGVPQQFNPQTHTQNNFANTNNPNYNQNSA